MHVVQARAGCLYTPTGFRKYLSADERRRFLATAIACRRPGLRTLCLTLVHTGCRISEALALTPASVEPVAGFVSIRCLKKREGIVAFREVPIPDDLIAELRAVHCIDTAEPQARMWPMSRSRAWQLVKEVMTEAGIGDGPHAKPKGLRHGFGLHAIRSGIPLNLVQRWLGHARLETTAIYLQAMGIEEREIAARMWSDTHLLIGAAPSS